MKTFIAIAFALFANIASAVTWHGTNVNFQVQRKVPLSQTTFVWTLETWAGCDLYGTVGGGGGAIISLTTIWGHCTFHSAAFVFTTPSPVVYINYPTKIQLSYVEVNSSTLKFWEDNRCITVAQAQDNLGNITLLRYDCSDTLFTASFDVGN